MEDNKKKIDEAWKEAVEKEKKSSSDDQASAEIEPSFSLFISGLMMEGLVALGAIENPVSKKKEANLSQAKYIIDTLGILQDKTRSNLTDEESSMLDSILYELRMRYVTKLDEKRDK